MPLLKTLGEYYDSNYNYLIYIHIYLHGKILEMLQRVQHRLILPSVARFSTKNVVQTRNGLEDVWTLVEHYTLRPAFAIKTISSRVSPIQYKSGKQARITLELHDLHTFFSLKR